jgi:hypothetical protein
MDFRRARFVAIGENRFLSAVDFEARAVKNEEIRSQDPGGIGG